MAKKETEAAPQQPVAADEAKASQPKAAEASKPSAQEKKKDPAPAKVGTVKERRALRQAAKREKLSKGEI